MRLLFAGTPQAAVPSLQRLIDSSHHQVISVLTRPATPQGRHRRLSPSPIAQWAYQHNIPVLCPSNPNSEEFIHSLRELAIECCAVVAYGALLRPALLEAIPQGWINLHFSLLPAWRGAAPVQAAIAYGETITGATTFRIEPALDTGPIYGVVTEPIYPDDTTGTLLDRLSHSGAQLLETTLDGIESQHLHARPQESSGISYAPKITSEEAHISWNLPAQIIERRIRAFTPDPGAWTIINNQRIKLAPVIIDPNTPSLCAGLIHIDRHHVWVGTSSEPVQLTLLQPPGKKFIPAADWARGAHLPSSVYAL